jgi:hypothetical protein
MSTHQAEFCSQRLQDMQNLYAEFFLLLDQSVQEDPFAEPTGLDRMIEQLMVTIDQEMKQFRREVEEARQGRALPETLQATLLEFDGHLAEGLKLMFDRVSRRTRELADAREQMKGRLQLIQRKRSGARGYRGHVGKSILLESQG